MVLNFIYAAPDVESKFRKAIDFGLSAAQFVLVAPDVLRLHDPVVLEHAGHRAVHSPTASPE